jgi:hypothetical protein
MQFVKPMPFQEAVDYVGDRTPIGSQLTSAEWQDVPVELRVRAQFSSEVESVRFLQRVSDRLNDFLENNVEGFGSPSPIPSPPGEGASRGIPEDMVLKVGSRAQFVEDMRAFALAEGMGPLSPETAGGLQDITSEQRLSLIFNVQTTQANSFGWYKQGLDADVLDEWPGMRFIRVQAVKEPRQSHEQYENQVYLKGDPIWEQINADFGVPWAPFGWGCGHDTEDVDRDECDRAGLAMTEAEKARLTDNQPSFNQGLQASTNGLDPDLIDKLKAEFGDQFIVDDTAGTMTWDEAAVQKRLAQTEPPARTSPVSEAIDVKLKGQAGELVNAGLAAIDRVHDDGVLPTIELKDTPQSDFGFLKTKQVGAGIGADSVAVRATGPWPAFTAVHEMGHFIDLEAIGAKGDLASRAGNPDMKAVLDVADKTQAIKGLRAKMATTANPNMRKYLNYLLQPYEIWARAYSQFVAEKAGNVTLERDLEKALKTEKWRQWERADFAPLSDAIEKLFKKLGWI